MKSSIVGLVVSLCLVSAKSFSSTNEDGISWGTPINGLQAGIAYHPLASQGSEAPRVTFALKNTGHEPLRLLKLRACARYWGDAIPLEVRQQGALIKYCGPILEPPPPPTDDDYVTLKTGDVDSVSVRPLATYWGLTTSDEVEVTFVFQNPLPGGIDLWTGEAKSGAIRIKMNPQSPPESPASISQKDAEHERQSRSSQGEPK